MAELKTYVMSVIAILFVATASVTMYSTALVNNIANGGNSTNTSFPLLNQTALYTAQMTNYSNDLAKSTYAAGTTQDWVGSLMGGIGTITQAGTGAISLTFSAINIMISILTSLVPTLGMIGIPSFILGFGLLSITVGIVFAILAALYKWWI
jgi:hypothetical protein